MTRFGRVLTAMVTPFDAEGGLDLDAARDLARWLEAHGNDGLVVAGTTGEAPVLTDDEKLSLWAAVTEAVSIPVIAGAGTNDTAHSVHLTVEASRLGVAGILAVGPYYNRPSQAGSEGHFRAVAAATDLPVMIYDIPIRTGRKISTATLLRLARDVPNLLALKDAAGNPGETAALIAERAGRVRGVQRRRRDDPAAAGLRRGRRGRRRHPLDRPRPPGDVRPLGQGRHRGARLVNARMLPRASPSRPATTPRTRSRPRRCCAHLGLPVGQARLPMGPAPDGLEDRAREVLANLERWREAFPDRPDRLTADRWPHPSASPSSAAWGRSVATAWSSSRTGVASSSTAG